MRSLSTPELSFLLAFSQLTYALVPDTDVVIVSNNDLDLSDPNRAGALLLRSPLTCPETASTCAQLQETLLPPTSTRADFTSENLTAVLASDRHGIMLPHGLSVWIAGNSYSDLTNLASCLPAICTNSAPLTRSDVISYDTTRQIDVSTPKAGISSWLP
ncbi:hypothetical protein JVT61DRAFT_11368 [Boletus reticuloceps]|uniref:Uncharacterized protein n=1 Tax=Boletus reticuloceps TaxID=495285 RepID=A0A8I2YEW5_9AGAM|nr:hypothetical protein JVT61DRAFT_11368 [Boletus reticuloceps]